MKKILLFVTALLLSFGLYAQNATPNRLLIHHNNTTSGLILNNVDSLTFAKVEGEVAANLEILSHNMEVVTLSVTRTESCASFKIIAEPTSKIASLNDYALARYIDRDSETSYYEDFEAGQLSGIDFTPNTNYTIATVGIDKYGVLCEVRKAEFKTGGSTITGDPQVTAELVDANYFDFTIKFTPNKDVSEYYVIAGAVGELEYQYETFAPMFGFENFEQIIVGWGLEYEGENTYTWKKMAPGTKHDILILAYDVNGVAAPYTTFNVTTDTLGGKGTAEVQITLGEYSLQEWSDEEGNPVMLPSQFITYTPNDQAGAFRFGVYTADVYDIAKDTIKQEICAESPTPAAGWFYYEEFTTDYQIDPNTECVVVAAAKNAIGEWGPLNEVRFTTPADVTSKSTSATIGKRENKITNEAGKVPSIKPKKLVLK